ncbi:MAG: hypothetical protein GKR87_03660 [Kiritimatiellae bacterium]|nr:hypothetical protein [Kiritimatiellia bacterium]
MEQTTEALQTRTESAGKWNIRIKSYKLGDQYICTVDNVDPGAVISRITSPTREEAESKAVIEAKMAMGISE